MTHTTATIRGLLKIAEMEKTARVFGAQVPNTVSSPHPAITNEQRRRDYESYLKEKASEGSTGMGVSTLVGAGLGAGMGALMGIGSRPGHYGVPVALGAGLGGLVGALAGHQDSKKVRIAKDVIARSKKDRNAIQESMAKELASQFARDREMQGRRDLHTNLALTNAVLGRPSYGYYY
jgi:hypothetical protein